MSKSKAPPGQNEPAKSESVEIEEPQEVRGSGHFLLPDNSSYEGDYIEVSGNKMRQGRGKMTCGPEQYEGGWENDIMHGQGDYLFASGAKYSGEFAAGFFHGLGEYTFPDGATYKGQWNSGKMHGEGVYSTKDRQEFKGQFINGYFDNGRAYISIRNHTMQV